jgi:L-iditol 2-dehydrogenase
LYDGRENPLTLARAAVLVSPGHIEIREYPTPEIGTGEMLLKVEMAGICGSDIHLYHGAEELPYPIILGHEFSATIEEMGKDSGRLEPHGRKLAVGDRVALFNMVTCGECYFCRFTTRRNMCRKSFVWGMSASCMQPPHLYGGWAEYIYVDKPRALVYKLPDDMSTRLNVLLDPMACAARALDRAFAPGLAAFGESFGPTKSVLVQGAGAIGTLCAAVAKICGARKVVMIGAPSKRLEIARGFGVDDTIDIGQVTNAEERVKIARRLSEAPHGPDLVIEAAGVPSALPEALDMVRPGGTVVVVGNAIGSQTVSFIPSMLCVKDVNLYGSYGYSDYYYETAMELLRQNKGRFPFEQMITHEFALDEAEKGVLYAESGEALKAVIVP